MSGSVTAFDNSGNGTATLTTGAGTITTGLYRGYSFTTSVTSSWEIDGLTIAAKALGSAGSYTLTAQLYATSSDIPVGGVLASVAMSVSLTTTQSYYSFDKATLGALATYTMSSGTGYALTFAPSATLVLGGTDPSAVPVGQNGFSYGGYVSSTNSGSSWGIARTPANYPVFLLQVQATCFLRGSLILTARGEVPVERLKAGDLVATKFGGLRPVRWMGTQRFEGRLAGRGHQPIRFAAGSLGNGMPSCDLRVSPGHAMLVQDGQGGEVLAHAGALVNGETITQERVRGEIEYFHIDLGPHDCVLANGAWAESYFEDRNRDAFHNAAEFHALNPGHAAERQATCLPIVTAEHPGIDGVQRLLAPRRMRRAA
ncbi:MAG: Hint domain-containing protein [Alphaproteobacteria bacterium]|nr:Hint domain-containing protein [Alphaproteobacteria bacterium]